MAVLISRAAFLVLAIASFLLAIIPVTRALIPPARTASHYRQASSRRIAPGCSMKATDDNMSELNVNEVVFRPALSTDIPVCLEIETASYPADEAASEASLRYRQEQAGDYFRCAMWENEVIGFVCSTRCLEFTAESMSTHVANAPLLAIHSVVVKEEFRRRGVAMAMLREYIRSVQGMESSGIQKVVLLAKQHLLGFYVNCGFAVTRPSPIVHGSEQWYDLEMNLKENKNDSERPCFIVNAFADLTDPVSTGNPAAVVLCSSNADGPKERQWMQTAAAEFNLSETAFVWPKQHQPENSKEVHYGIRYYTPTVEVALCGHATLASAAVLFQTGAAVHGQQELVFHALKDALRATTTSKQPQEEEAFNSRPSSGKQITMEFPIKPATALDPQEHTAVARMMQKGLGIDTQSILFAGLSKDIGDLLIEVTPESFSKIGFGGLDFSAFLSYEGYSRGVIVCCAAPVDAPQVDFVSRFFGPKAGIDEDPVTGSAHCILAPHFCDKLGKDVVVGKQQSRRGGIVECKLTRPNVQLSGYAATVVSGELFH